MNVEWTLKEGAVLQYPYRLWKKAAAALCRRNEQMAYIKRDAMLV